jgi:hypothetical protein
MKFFLKVSHKPDKKYDGVFVEDDGHKKVIPFGAKGYTDYTKSHDKDRKDLYLKRHQKHEDWNDPKTAGALSKYILWNKPTIKESVANFKNKFRLQ